MDNQRKPCLIACGILKQEINKLVEDVGLDADVQFLSEKFHCDYGLLDKALSKVLEISLKDYPDSCIVVYGDACLGFNNEMKTLINKYGVVKVDALNCIDCLLGGKGKLLEIDPEHTYLFLTPGFMKFFEPRKLRNIEETRKMFSKLKGIILLDTLGNLDDYRLEIEEICDYTGLPILEKKDVGLGGLKSVIVEALQKLAGKC